MTQTLESPPQAAPNGNGNGNQLAHREKQRIVINDESPFANLLDTGRFEHMWRVSQLFAASTMVPIHFQKKPEDCFVAMQMAVRLGVDPFMFMQNTFVCQGKPSMEGKLAIALVNTSGLFTGPLSFEFSGTGDDYGCRAVATMKGTGERVEGPRVTLKVAKEEGWYGRNQKWKTITDLMLTYRAGAWFGRTKCPERLMGMQTIEELQDIGEAKPIASRVRDDSRKAGKLAARLSQGQTLETETGEVIEGDEGGDVQAEAAQQLGEHDFAVDAPVTPQEKAAFNDAPEPDTSEPPPAKEMTPNEKWWAEIDEARDAAEIKDHARFKSAVLDWTMRNGIKGKEHKATAEQMKVLLSAIAEKSGKFAFAAQ